MPAIVFDDQYVIYGETDLNQAIKEHQDYEQTKINN